MNHFIFIILFFISAGLSAQHSDYIVRKENDTTWCKIKRISNRRIYFNNKSEQKLYNELSDVLGYKKENKGFVHVKINYAERDTIIRRPYGIALGMLMYLLPTKYKGLYQHNQKAYPYYPLTFYSSIVFPGNSSFSEAESYKNAFGYIYHSFPFIEFRLNTNKFNNQTSGGGYYKSSKSIEDYPYNEAIKLINFNLFYQFDFPISKKRFKKKKPLGYFYTGSKISWNYKKLMYYNNIHMASFGIINNTLSYSDKSYLGSVQVPIGYRSIAHRIHYDIGININLMSYIEGEYDITYKTGPYYDYDPITLQETTYYITENKQDTYSKTLFIFMKNSYFFNDLYFKVGYRF